MSVSTTPVQGIELLMSAARHRVELLLGQARRRSLLVWGADAVSEAWQDKRASLILVAADAAAAAKIGAVRQAVPLGCVKVWGTKAQFGAIFGRPEVGVVAVVDETLAKGLFDAIALALLGRGAEFVSRSPWAAEEKFGSQEVESSEN
ncbi:MAG: hypothetical protein MK135_03885 [Polyangiaceae bacterium]|nr:hypothetical protein [Polyangiaceae bacterium]